MNQAAEHPPLTLPFVDIDAMQQDWVGSEATSMSTLYRDLNPLGISVPNGFVVTPHFLHRLIEHNDLRRKFETPLQTLSPEDLHGLFATGSKVRASIIHGTLPSDCTQSVDACYNALADEYGERPDVWLRPSLQARADISNAVTGSDGRLLNISGFRSLLAHIQLCFATLFSDRAIAYRLRTGLPPFPDGMSIVVQKMVRADRSVSGVMLTADPDSGWDNVLLVDAGWGLRDLIHRGTIVPDEFMLFKPMLREGRPCILRRALGSKRKKLVYSNDQLTGIPVREVRVAEADQTRFCINDTRLVELGRIGLTVEALVRERAELPLPLAIDWAVDSSTGELVISRVESAQQGPHSAPNDAQELPSKAEMEIIRGRSIGHGNAQGPARVLADAAQIEALQPGDILITTSLEPEWLDAFDRISGVIVANGGVTSHGARMARRRRIPMLIAHEEIHNLFQDGETISLSCAQDGIARAWRGPGLIRPSLWKRPVSVPEDIPFMLNLKRPQHALWASTLPAMGVGLVQMEQILSAAIGLHPDLASQPSSIPKAKANRLINASGYQDLHQYIIQQVAESVGMIAAAFYPRQVIIRLSDQTSAEFSHLIGGTQPPSTDPQSPSLRGAARYLSERYRTAFELECQALRMVREQMGLKNIALMVPFVRTLAEAEGLDSALSAHSLGRDNGLLIYLMADLPVNVLMAPEFLNYYDGLCLGMQDLTQLTLGSHATVADDTLGEDSREALRRLVTPAIETCQKHNKPAFAALHNSQDLAFILELHKDLPFRGIAVYPQHLAGSIHRFANPQEDAK